MSIEAMKQVRETFVKMNHTDSIFVGEFDKEIALLDQAIEQAEQAQPMAWINWCAATGKRSVSFECESELASEPLYTKEQL